MPPLTAAKERSSILKLPAGLRTDALNKLSANANAPGGCKRQNGGRGKQGKGNIRNALGIYLIESTFTASLAASVGGATPATITIESGTPGTTAIATDELDPVTWAGAGTRSLTVAINTTEVLGNAKLAVA